MQICFGFKNFFFLKHKLHAGQILNFSRYLPKHPKQTEMTQIFFKVEQEHPRQNSWGRHCLYYIDVYSFCNPVMLLYCCVRFLFYFKRSLVCIVRLMTFRSLRWCTVILVWEMIVSVSITLLPHHYQSNATLCNCSCISFPLCIINGVECMCFFTMTCFCQLYKINLD